MQRIQMLDRGQRLLIFILIFGGGLMFILAVTVFIILQIINASPRDLARPVSEEPIQLPISITGDTQLIEVNVAEFAQLPDDGYPSSVSVGPDGRVYTGSRSSGAVWAFPPEGNLNDDGERIRNNITELSATRDLIGAVTGLEVAPDGTLYILDRLDSNPGEAGGTLWRTSSDGTLIDLGEIDSAGGFVSPGFVTIDAAGNVYVTDVGEREVWRYAPDGESILWWSVPGDDPSRDDIVPNGIVYDETTDTILISDAEVGVIFRISMDGLTTETVYRYDSGGADDPPGFAGLDVTEAGIIVVAAQAVRSVVMVDPNTSELIYLADNFRSVTDVAIDGDRIYAANLDGRSLAISGVDPQLPFGIDVITLNPVE